MIELLAVLALGALLMLALWLVVIHAIAHGHDDEKTLMDKRERDHE